MHLNKALKASHISTSYSNISDKSLDKEVKSVRKEKPNAGIRYIWGRLRVRGYKIQRSRIIGSLKRVDPLGQQLRKNTAIKRRKYQVARPNALWHMDGHHKLIRWGIVLHGIVDGYGRLVSKLVVSECVQSNVPDAGSLGRRSESQYQ